MKTLIALLLGGVCFAAEPGIRFPVASAPSVSVDTLSADEWYVIDADVECFFRTAPTGVVTIKTEAGPIRMKGKFAGGGGKVETREFKGKFVTTIEAVKAGTIELLIIPVGVTEDGKIQQRTLAVMGHAPQPPPIPPGPTPPTPTGVVKWAVVVEETSQRKLDGVLTDLKYWNGLTAKGIKYRFYDKDSPDVPKGYVAQVAGKYPSVILLSAGGDPLATFELTTTAAIDSKIAEVSK